MIQSQSSEFWTTNPATGEKLKSYCLIKERGLIEPCLNDLADGFKSWQKLSFKDRQEILLPTADLIDGYKEKFAVEMTLQMGKPFVQALAEIKKCSESIRYMCTNSYDQLTSEIVTTDKYLSDVCHRPLGIILAVMPWNFPLWQVVRMIYPALLMGNVILLKHSEITPSIGVMIESLFAQLKTKVLRHALFDHALTESIIADSRISGVSLTGSTQAGYKLSEYAGKYLKRGVFELGGSDAYLVLEDADIILAAKTILKSRLHNTGQTCISAKRALIPKSMLTLFLTELKNEIKNYQFGDLMRSGTQLGPLAHVRFKNEYFNKRKLINDYVELQMSVQPPEADLDDPKKAFVPVEVLLVKDENSTELRKIMNDLEFFSPTLMIYAFDSEEQAIDLMNSTKYGLGSAIFTKDIEKAKDLAGQIQAGICVINDQVNSDVRLPFGGFKSSGLGRETGIQGFFEFTQTQVISTRRSF